MVVVVRPAFEAAVIQGPVFFYQSNQENNTCMV